ncbi:hypothetical protein Glove_137g28 [Diversispora epigaea]|uniref:Protein kinase domain-containing protein n=1 Tax=Diversispora epigaea TaxID=1348612 RepID=A0A397J0T5_9GLOM|nr:hypothetical protein Glove_137g28 [Diversispora epigaea]
MDVSTYCPECNQYLDFNYWCQPCQTQQFQENFDNWSSGFKEIDDFIRSTQINANDCTEYLEWLPFDSFIGINKYDSSEVGTVYTANWKKGPTDTWDGVEKKYVAKRELVKVALISVGKTPAAFLKELKLHHNSRKKHGLIVRLFGATKETVTGQLMMIAETCEWDLRHYVSHHYAKLSWSHKIGILYTIANALESMHKNEQTHRDLSSKNNQTFKSHLEIPINQLSLGDSKDTIPIIGYYKNDLLPYFAPEILRGEPHTKKCDIYSFGILMWELSTNKLPFHDSRNSKLIDSIRYRNLRPLVEVDTPDCYVKLMKNCWSPNQDKRPSASELVKTLEKWHLYKKESNQFNVAEKIRIKDMETKGLNTKGKLIAPPKTHPQAIYVSRKLKFPILPPDSMTSRRVNNQSYFDKNNHRKTEEVF